MKIAKLGLLLLAAVVVSACGTADGLKPGSFEVRLGVSEGMVGTRLRPSAMARELDGSLVGLSEVVTWSVDDASVASFIEPGVLRFNAPGKAVITARYGEQSASTEVSVTDAPIARLEVQPGLSSLQLGERQAFTLVALRVNGTSEDVSALAQWTFLGALARGNTGNEALAAARGVGLVRATIGGQEATLRLDVWAFTGPLELEMPPMLELGEFAPVHLVQVDELGSRQDVSAGATWVSSNASVVTVEVENGLPALRVHAPGVVDVAATWNGRRVSASLEVREPGSRVVGIVFQPLYATQVRVGERVPVTAWAQHADGSVSALPQRTAWASSDPRIAQVMGGLVTGLSPGRAMLTARVDGVVADAPVDVVLQAVTLIPSQTKLELALGERTELTLSALHADDGHIDDLTAEADVASTSQVVVQHEGARLLVVAVARGAGEVVLRARGRVVVVPVNIR